jgi:predicted 2-oxoglutarate/Fe(II)-dependent dioxygenase YbiX
MSTIIDEFKQNKYLHIQEVLSPDALAQLSSSLKAEVADRGWHDHQCPKSKSVRDSKIFDQLLVDLLPTFEEVTGLKLYPTYAFARLYAPGEELLLHLDRDACEISATVTLDFEGDVWPIYVGTPSDDENDPWKISEMGEKSHITNISKINMKPGDAVVYRGCEMYHWREKYTEGKWQAQVFLHYVDANGPCAEWKFDKRPKLNNAKNDDLTYWCYNDVLTPQDCDAVVSAYSQMESSQADVGIDGIRSDIDTSIRNVNKVVLPTYKGIGAILTAAGLDANQQRWKFDIDKSNQCEFLRYPAGGGRYKGHLDTFLSNETIHLQECRKLTVLAFLNDNFTGGKFFLQMNSQRFYPPQTKGTVLVFPSFLLHGVEDVEEGERFSAVCWLVGPWFK